MHCESKVSCLRRHSVPSEGLSLGTSHLVVTPTDKSQKLILSCKKRFRATILIFKLQNKDFVEQSLANDRRLEGSPVRH